MTKGFALAVGMFLLAAMPAYAQLSPVYGSLRTALENSMAQTFPPYGVRQDAATHRDDPGQTGAAAAKTDASAGKLVSSTAPNTAAENEPLR